MYTIIPSFTIMIHHILHHLGLALNKHLLPFICHLIYWAKFCCVRNGGGGGNGSLAAASAASLALASVSILCCLDSSPTTIAILSP
jgi:hypothetical protein